MWSSGQCDRAPTGRTGGQGRGLYRCLPETAVVKFSVLLPTRNRLDLLRYAVESVIRQDYSDWEVIVADNCSNEDVAGYVAGLNDSRIRYFRTTASIPVTDNWNFALGQSTGDYVVMLGDDDCLLKGYFRLLSQVIKQFSSPDFIYTDAFQYAYPGVIPGHPRGFLQIGHATFLKEPGEPFLLPRKDALKAVENSLRFRVTFGFNMQHFLVSRSLITQLESAGPFFQSPYPDYYAGNAMFLKANRILIVPKPLVVIGISKKSFGFYYANDRESEGVDFLNNASPENIPEYLKSVVLPGSEMNTSWLAAMQILKMNYSDDIPVDVDYRRYRLLQILSNWRRGGVSRVCSILPRLGIGDLMLIFVLLAVGAIMKISPGAVRRNMYGWLIDKYGAYPRFDARMKPVDYQNILEVFENQRPEYY